VVVGCAAAITIAGCKPGLYTSTSSGATPSAGTSTAAGTAQTGSATSAIATVAGSAAGVNSFVAKLDIHATGHLAADLSGTLTEQAQPGPLVEVQTTVPSGLEAILSGDTAYLKIGALTQTAGKPWIKASIGGLDSSAGAALAPIIQQLQAGNPLAQSQMFTAATNVREVGTATVSGVPTTGYSGSYSLAAGLAKLPASQRAERHHRDSVHGLGGREPPGAQDQPGGNREVHADRHRPGDRLAQPAGADPDPARERGGRRDRHHHQAGTGRDHAGARHDQCAARAQRHEHASAGDDQPALSAPD
jgi:hypothetical protein